MKHRRGKLPLWFAITLGVIFLMVIAVWTWRSTGPTQFDGRQEIVAWNAGLCGDDVYLALHQFEQKNPQ